MTTTKKAAKKSKKLPPKAPLQRTIGYLKRHRRIIAIIFVGLLIFAGMALIISRTLLPVHLAATTHDVKVDQPITITLNQFVQPIDTKRITISPAVDGSWKFTQPNFVQNGTLVFTPKTYFTAHTAYTITLPSAKRAFGTAVTLPAVHFTTEQAPSLTNTGIASWKDGQIIAADAPLVAKLASPNHHLRALELRTSPAIETKLSVDNDTTFTWKPAATMPQNTDLTVEVYDTKNQQSLVKKSVHIAAEPALTSPLHQENIDEHGTVSLTFAQPIDPATAHISFDLAGKGTWTNDTTYTFTPEKVSPNTTYRYTIAKNMRSRDGGILQNDITGDFATVGPIRVTHMSPYGNGLSQASQTLTFAFSRPVDHASAEQRLSTSSGQIGRMSWNGNTLSVVVTNLGYQQTFTASIAAGVKNTSFGVPSAQAFSLSFTTEVRSARLNVPAYIQQHAGTCTAASLRMALAYRGVGSDEVGLVNAMGYNPRPMDKSTDPPTWDDSQTMFVGSIDGSIAAGTGAGPDAPPVAKAARAYGRGADAVTGIGSGWIAQQIYNGNPIIMFGAFRNTGTISWKTPSGATRVMNLTGHATVVIGVKGEPSAPLGFWVNDPLGGTSYWTTGQVEANIARDPDRQAVVVY